MSSIDDNLVALPKSTRIVVSGDGSFRTEYYPMVVQYDTINRSHRAQWDETDVDRQFSGRKPINLGDHGVHALIKRKRFVFS